MSEKFLGPLSVIGAGIGYLIIGFPHSWGGLSAYMMSYHTYYSPGLSPQIFEWIYPILLIGEAASFLSAPFLIRHLSSRRIVMLMSFILSLCILMNYFTYSSLLSCFGFAFGAGFTSGMIQIVCIYPPTSYYPNSIGKISCVLNASFTIGFGALCTFYKIICNPGNTRLDPNTLTYPIDVIENFPRMLFVIALTMLFLGFISSIFLTEKLDGTDLKAEASISHVVKTLQFWIALGFAFISFHSNLFALSNFKIVGMYFINDDDQLTLAQQICTLASFIGRLVWGPVCQRFGFKKVSFFVVALLAINFYLFTLNFTSIYWYTTMGAALFFLSSFHYSGLLVFCNLKYGLKLSSSVYGYLLLATSPTTINLGIIKSLTSLIGYNGIFYILAAIMTSGLLLNFQISEKPYKCTKKSSFTSLI